MASWPKRVSGRTGVGCERPRGFHGKAVPGSWFLGTGANRKERRPRAVYEKANWYGSFHRFPPTPLCCVSKAGDTGVAHAAVAVTCLF